MNLSHYTIEELVEIKNQISDAIFLYDDGYKYICNVRSYGRTWVDKGIKNVYTLQDLCDEYNGDDGIVDVYSTNPNLSEFRNYGDVMYIKSVEDYYKWKKYENLKREIPELEKELDEWDNRDNVPFNKRPYFAPIYTKEDIIEMKKQLEEYDMSFTPPKRYE
jgi:hypothetical protein